MKNLKIYNFKTRCKLRRVVPFMLMLPMIFSGCGEEEEFKFKKQSNVRINKLSSSVVDTTSMSTKIETTTLPKASKVKETKKDITTVLKTTYKTSSVTTPSYYIEPTVIKATEYVPVKTTIYVPKETQIETTYIKKETKPEVTKEVVTEPIIDDFYVAPDGSIWTSEEEYKNYMSVFENADKVYVR